jgi:hypothetical protein
MSVWNSFDVPEAGYVNLLNDAIKAVERRTPNLFTPVDSGFQILASDYSGQHRGSTHDVYSFVVTTLSDLQNWLPLRDDFRSRWLPDGRRLSFKQLREPLRRRAYPHFLEMCGALRGNIITVMIDNKIGSLIDGGPEGLATALDDCFAPNATSNSIEKIYRLALFVAMIVTGLRREDQPSLWISDHDETLDSFEKRERFARLTTYLTFGLSRRQESADQTFMTTLHEALPDWGEDLAAIPDIAAGACANLSDVLPLFVQRKPWTVGFSYGDSVDWRSKVFADWLSSSKGELRHVLLRLAPDSSGDIRASAQHFVRKPHWPEHAVMQN